MSRYKALRSPRFARRAHKKTVRRVIVCVLAAGLFFGVVLFFAIYPAFSIREVVVSGVGEEMKSEITGIVNSQLAGVYFGVIPKSSALFYPEKGIENSITAGLPRIAGSVVRLVSPTKLSVTVAERAPAALWCSDTPFDGAEECFFIDTGGFAFDKAPSGIGHLYYRLIGYKSGESPFGKSVIDGKRLVGLLSFLSSLNALSLSPRRLTLLSGDDVSAEIDGGGLILARESEDLKKQVENLRGLLSEKDLVPRKGENLHVLYIDLRYGNKLYFKPR